jgi:chemotaxis protein MotB
MGRPSMARDARSRRSAHDRWLVSYADFMTLLFAFFATMYAISSVDSMKLTKVAHALQIAFDNSATKGSIVEGSGVLPERGSRLVPGSDGAAGALEIVRRELAPELADHRIELSIDRRGLILSIPEAGLFAIGSDELSPPAQILMERVAATLANTGNLVRVEGHTDDLPIHTTRFRSNWDLSTARATRVIESLIVRGGLAPERLSAAGYAEFRPRVLNLTTEGRSKNRRVDLVVLNDTTSLAEEPSARRSR